MRKLASPLSLGALVLLLAAPARAVTITIVNTDPAGQGLNDSTPATPVGGNPGTTIGQQRLNVFNRAASIWGEILPGNIEIRVDASFSSTMDCSSTTAVLGGTSPTYVESDFTGAPVPGTWYVVAQANQIAGRDLEPGQSHMTAQFNAKLGQTGCLDGSFFYYGFDTNTPVDDVNFLTTALHEFAHGLGFISLVDETTGKFCCSTTLQPDIFDAFVYDATKGKSFNQMSSNADRQAAAIDTGHLVWIGPAANAAGAAYLSKKPLLYVTSPPAVSGTMNIGTATFGGAITEGGLSGTLVASNPSDPGGSSSTDGCTALSSPVAGKIVLINRGTCNFTVKARNAQNAGATGVVIANYAASVVNMSGTDATVTIPVISVSSTDASTLRTNLPAEVKIGLDPTQRAGMNAAGQLLLYAPNPVEAGSNVSHWDTSTIPDLLMEPNISTDLPIGVDITPDALRDVGWFGGTPAGSVSYVLPSVAHTAGGTPTAPAFYTSDLFVANQGPLPASFSIQFLGHDVDGTGGASQSFSLGPGMAATYRDVLASVFGLTGNNYGALRIAANSSGLRISSVTTTPTPGQTGAFGQSVPGVPAAELITPAAPAALAGIREDGVARTNLVLLNATASPLDVSLSLSDDSGKDLGTVLVHLFPFEMTQLGRVVWAFTAQPVSNATLALSTATSGGAFTAFASLVDNGTNDPATLLPGAASAAGSVTRIVPSVARTAGGTVSAPAYYTSDLFIANQGNQTAHYTIRFLAANTADGRTGPEQSFSLLPGQADTYRDVLGTVFGLSSDADYGALQITSDVPGLVVDSVTTTKALAPLTGRFGQSVPGIPSSGWIPNAGTGTIPGIREDATARTNLVLVNATERSIEIDIALYADDGTPLGTTMQKSLPPLGMTQIGRIIEAITGARNTANATLVLWTPTTGGSFTAFASLVNNGTDDPATLLPE
ncbi:MAG: PA domain-containing protein [Acidithiobacillales bacterium]